MEKKPSLSRPQRLLKSERWRPYIRFEKETGGWIAKAIKVDGTGKKKMDRSTEKEQLEILMDRDQLDIIARLVADMYHDKKDEYEELASDMRKEHIYKDLRSIDIWLNSQYKRLEKEDEQSKQKERKRI